MLLSFFEQKQASHKPAVSKGHSGPEAWTSVGGLSQPESDLPWPVLGREWVLALDVWWPYYYSGWSESVCVCVSLPALVQLVVPCGGGWLVLVTSALRPSFIPWQGSNVEAHSTIERLSSSQLARAKAVGSSHSLETPAAPLACL